MDALRALGNERKVVPHLLPVQAGQRGLGTVLLANAARRAFARLWQPSDAQEPPSEAWVGAIVASGCLAESALLRPGEHVACGLVARSVGAPLRAVRHEYARAFHGELGAHPDIYLDFLEGQGVAPAVIDALQARAQAEALTRRLELLVGFGAADDVA